LSQDTYYLKIKQVDQTVVARTPIISALQMLPSKQSENWEKNAYKELLKDF